MSLRYCLPYLWISHLWRVQEFQSRPEYGSLDTPSRPDIRRNPLLPKNNRGSTFALRRPTLDFCLGEQRISLSPYRRAYVIIV